MRSLVLISNSNNNKTIHILIKDLVVARSRKEEMYVRNYRNKLQSFVTKILISN